jgi:hypothetical protein
MPESVFYPMPNGSLRRSEVFRLPSQHSVQASQKVSLRGILAGVRKSGSEKRRGSTAAPCFDATAEGIAQPHVWRHFLDAPARFLAMYPTFGAATIGVLAAASTVTIVQPLVANVTSWPAITEIGTIAAAVGLIAYGGWRAATDPHDTPVKSPST